MSSRHTWLSMLWVAMTWGFIGASPETANAQEHRGTLEPGSVYLCPARDGMCAEWGLKATRTGTVSAVVTTDEAVTLGELKTWKTERLEDGKTTRFSWEAEAGKQYTLPLRTVFAPSRAVGYALALDGLELVRPPSALATRDWETERARAMKRQPKTDFSRSSRGLKQELGFLRKDAWNKDQVLKGTFDGPLRLDLTVSRDRCYYFVMRMKGRWSPIARRGAYAFVIGPDGRRVSVFDFFYKDAARIGMACPQRDGPMRLSIYAGGSPAAPWAGELATGSWSVAVWSKSSSPFAFDAKAFETTRKASLKGMRRTKVVHKGDLAAFEPFDLVARAGRCYAVVVSLGKDGAWTNDAREAGNVSFNGDFAGLDVSGGPGVKGPGAIGQLGCFVAGRPGVVSITARRKPAMTGTGTIELYEGAMPRAELDEVKRELRRKRQTLDDLRNKAWGQTCRWCAERRAACDDAGQSDCEAAFRRCVTTAGYNANGCGS